MTAIPREEESPQVEAIPPDTLPENKLPAGRQGEIINQAALGNEKLGEDYSASKKLLEMLVTNGGLPAARQEVQATDLRVRQEAAIATANTASSDPEVDASSLLSLIADIQQVGMDPTAMEKRAIDAVSPLDGTEDNALLRARERSQKALITSNFMAQMQAEAEDDFDFGWDAVVTLTLGDFLNRTAGLGTLDWVGEAQSVLADLENAPVELLPALLDQKKEFFKQSEIIGNNPDYILELMDASQISEEGRALALSLLGLEAVFAAVGGVKFLRGAKSLFDSTSTFFKLSRELNKPAVAADIGNVSKKIAVSNEEVAESVITSSPYQQLSLSATVERVIKANDDEADRVLQQFTAPVAPEVVSGSSIKDKVLERWGLGDNRQRIRNIIMSNDDGLTEIWIGTSAGKGFRSVKGAQKYIKDMGIDAQTLFTDDGFFVRVTSELDEGLFPVAFAEAVPVSSVAKAISNIDSIIDPTLISVGRQAEGAADQLEASAGLIYKNSIGRLKRKQLKDFNRLLSASLDNERWYDGAALASKWFDLTGRVITGKEVAAYRGYRTLSDLSYNLLNKVEWDGARRRGMSSLTIKRFNGEEMFNGKVVPGTAAKGVMNRHVYDIHTRTITKRISADEVEDAIKEGRKTLIEIDGREAMKIAKDTGVPVKYALVNTKDLTVDALNPKQINYVAGGRRKYNIAGTIKQHRITEYPDGTKVRLRDKAFFGGTTLRQLSKKVEDLNAGRLLMLRVANGEVSKGLADEFFDGLGFESTSTFKKMVDDLGMDLNTPFSAVPDGGKVELSDVIDVDLSDVSAGARGMPLQHVDGGISDILDPMAALTSSVDNSMRVASLDGFKETLMMGMSQKFGRYMEPQARTSIMNMLDPRRIDSKAIAGNGRLGVAIEAHQEWAKSILRHRSQAEKLWAERADNLIDQAFNEGLGGFTALRVPQWGIIDRPRAQLALSKALSQDPVGKAKGVFFDMGLGLFSVPALILQASQAPIIAAVSGKNGLKSLSQVPFMRMALASDAARDHIAKVIKSDPLKAKAVGFDEMGDFLEQIDEFKNLGLGHFGRNLHYIDGYSGSHFANSFLSRIRQSGRMFFEQGEMIPRLTAYSTARRKWINNIDGVNPNNLPATSNKGRGFIQNESKRLTFGMTASDIQLAFKGKGGLAGVFSVMSQYWSYPFRAINAMFPQKGFGGSTAFTVAEKQRMWAAYIAMYGTAGIPIVDTMTEIMFESPNSSLAGVDKALGFDTPGQAYKFFENGIIDGILFAATDGELDVDFSARAGLGNYATDFYHNIRDLNLVNILGAGPRSVSTGWDAATIAAGAYGVFTNPSLESVSEVGIAMLSSSVSSLSMATKALHAIQTGMLVDRKGKDFAKINSKSIAAMAIGLPPAVYHRGGLLFDTAKDRREMIKEGAAMFTKLHKEWQSTKDRKILEHLNVLSSNYRERDPSLHIAIVNEAIKIESADPTIQGMVERNILNALEGGKLTQPNAVEIERNKRGRDGR